MAPHTRKNLASAFTGHKTLRLGLPRPFWKLSNFVLHIDLSNQRRSALLTANARSDVSSNAVQHCITGISSLPYFVRPSIYHLNKTSDEKNFHAVAW